MLNNKNMEIVKTWMGCKLYTSKLGSRPVFFKIYETSDRKYFVRTIADREEYEKISGVLFDQYRLIYIEETK